MERLEQLALIVLRNANAVIPNDADRVWTFVSDSEIDGVARFGIFDGIAQEIGENVAEELGIDLVKSWAAIAGARALAAVVSGPRGK